jgi:hypothetical protein
MATPASNRWQQIEALFYAALEKHKGEVVGAYTDSSGAGHGLVYTISSQSWQTIDDPNGLGNTVVNGINDSGVLVGFDGSAPTNDGFIATPQK